MYQSTKQVAVLCMALSASIALAQQPAQGTDASAKAAAIAHQLTNPELDRLLAHPESLVVIDVRRPDEVSTIGGFPVYLSIQLSQLESSLAWIPKDRTVVVVSNHAGRASRAAQILAGKGFKVAGAAGAQTYEKAGGTIAHFPIPPPREASGPAAGQNPPLDH
jgi:rhodanese-related sulfurtransferase